MKKEQTKLKPEYQVLYFDGSSIMEVTNVVSVDKSKDEATLGNGVRCSRKADKHGNFKRIDYKKKSFKGFIRLYPYSIKEENIYELWKFRQRILRNPQTVLGKIAKIEVQDLMEREDTVEYLAKVRNLIKELA